MGILEKLLGSHHTETSGLETTCAHISLVQRPRQNNRTDIEGEPATYLCTSCGEELTFEHARSILNLNEPALTHS